MKESDDLVFKNRWNPYTSLTEVGNDSQPNPLHLVVQKRVANDLVFKKENLRAI